jgi:hypothetical protein
MQAMCSIATSPVGILNCLYGAQVMHSEDMAAVFCRATNDWIRDRMAQPRPGLRARS